MIKKLSNRRERLIKSLISSKKRRTLEKSFVVEGLKGVKEALKSGFKIDFVVVSQDFASRYDLFPPKTLEGLDLALAPQDRFNQLSDTVTPQGILAVVGKKDYDLKKVLGKSPLLVALDRVTDPGNLGTILRTSHAAGAGGLILGKGCVDIYNPKLVRATMGSIFHLPIFPDRELVPLLADLKSQNFQVVTTHLEGDRSYWDVDYRKPTVIIMGNEDDGVSQDLVNLCDIKAVIRMPGNAESLNVSVAQGIVIFEAVKQRICPELSCKGPDAVL